ncbi:flagellar hook-length control protein FliK [Caulobacter endophyticus]|uniref:flagellar hook-length control protein FliK n=1 Tax=Caulobacter endophyticus TaxID=2172652 RepID=UPI00240F8469|nr:flagellar hook-length control protein FliK [Caulobacter endophyticus]MDG2529538.1 flagellar hook-length control protein FliK [Caulobacter endophyticus]
MSVLPIGTVVPNLASVQPTATIASAGLQGGQTGQAGLPPPAMLAQMAMAEATEALGKIAAQPGATPDAPDTVESLLKGGATGQAREILLSSATVQAKVVSDMVGRAASTQAGMAPLLADLERVTASPQAPALVRQAAANMLALRSPIDGAVTAGEIRQAFGRSGLFMESRLAEEASAPGAAPLAAKDLKAAMLVLRAAVASWSAQTGPGPSATATSTAALQAPQQSPTQGAATSVPAQPAASQLGAQAAASMLPGLPPQGAAPAAPEGEAPPPATTASAAADDPAVESPVARFLAAVAPRPAPQQAAQPAAALFVLAQEAAAGFEEAPVVRPIVTPLAPPPGKGPPPPFAGGPVVAQPAASSTLAPDARPALVAQQLAKGVDAALARQELLQAASLPERTEAARPADGRLVDDKPGPRWVFDVPFATPQGSAVAQFEISRDGGGGGAAGGVAEARTWKVRFSLDVEPMGRIDAQLALTGERARVSLWAERPEAMARLRGGEEMLNAALREAALEPEVAFHAVALPVAAPAAPGRFLDQAT